MCRRRSNLPKALPFLRRLRFLWIKVFMKSYKTICQKMNYQSEKENISSYVYDVCLRLNPRIKSGSQKQCGVMKGNDRAFLRVKRVIWWDSLSFSFHVIKRSPIKLISVPFLPSFLAYVQAVSSYFNVASVCAKWVEETMGRKNAIKMLMTLAIKFDKDFSFELRDGRRSQRLDCRAWTLTLADAI